MDVEDNCTAYNDLTITQTPAPNTTYNIGDQIPVEIKATDLNGNTTTIDFVLTVADSSKPVFDTCLTDTLVFAPTSPKGLEVTTDTLDPVVSDCSDITLVNDLNNSNTLEGAVIPIGVNNITWTATDAFGNESQCVMIIKVTEWTKVAGIDNEVNVYPIPATDKVYVKLNKDVRNAKVEIIDLSGRVVKQFNINSRVNRLDVSDLSSGTYVLKVLLDKDVIIRNIIKK